MPRIWYSDSPSFRSLRDDDLQSWRLPPDRGPTTCVRRKCQCAETSMGADGAVVKREAHDADQDYPACEVGPIE